ncbi:MAG: OPT/YSL family transporter [Deltaproteobacteria bacterium]|nr:OPT/YSL family transporter [Deltaproteobacteria bacterium]
MAIEQLTPEQVRDWTLQQKDDWWLANVYRGDMPQLTFRAAVTGFLLGGVLSATNLYIGAKTGWTLGVGLTSVILAYAAFRLAAQLRLAKDMSVLENNAAQSIATAAGYMTGPLVSGMAAYMWIENRLIPWWQMLLFNIVLSILGVLVAFPMKRRFINDEQQPFPEGQACGVVLDALYSGTGDEGMQKARVLVKAGGLASLVGVLTGENLMELVQKKWLGLKQAWHLPHNLDAWYYALVEKGMAPEPKLAGVPIRSLGLSPTLDLAMLGAGGLMGMRSAAGMLVGMLLNYVVIVPWMILLGEIKPRADGTFTRTHVVNTWALWWGIVIMVVASLVSLASKPEVFTQAFANLRRARKTDNAPDRLASIELPMKVSLVGVPIVGVLGVYMAHEWFGVSWVFGLAALPLIVVLTLIAASSTGMTGITPTGSLSKIPQFIFGALDPKHPPTNLMTGVMCVEVAGNASNLLMDIKPGYMLGAKPRQQAIGHTIGIVAGALASTPLFYLLFLSNYRPGDNVQAAMAPEGGAFGFPSALQWKGVSELVTAIFGGGGGTLLTRSIVVSMVLAAVAAIVMEVLRLRTKGRFPLSPLAIGLGVVLPPDSTIAMFAGAALFAWMHRRHGDKPGTSGHALWVGSHEPICAGLIAGAALVGIGDILVKVFLL